MASTTAAAVLKLAKRIPRGRVMTYGQIAKLVDGPMTPRAVGWALHRSGDDKIPWHRVVNAAGACSTEQLPAFPPGLQRELLRREGVVFRSNGTLDLKRYRWNPRS